MILLVNPDEINGRFVELGWQNHLIPLDNRERSDVGYEDIPDTNIIINQFK